uniref:Ubiquitin-like modifier-activating enzyme 1 n=1 Tax=Dermatophagoides pteronyssinus TaxID=6956 RepID=A0A6P6Y7L5_DERPT|nr:ubiquitin-like modifier-activating enzyme 1 [Dermatophagoides pteronyssinus]
MNQEYKNTNSPLYCEKLNVETLNKLFRLCDTQFCPLSSIVGALAAQETIKYTGKYIPLNQWFFCDFAELAQDEVTSARELTAFAPRYEHLIRILGSQNTQILQNAKLFCVGLGALGCEYMKLLALLGAGSGADGELFITDMDNIELSNLNRQFLFQEQHIGLSKAEVAAEQALAMNRDLKFVVHKEKLDVSTENIFDRKFWLSVDCVLNGLDNVESRQYVDGKCVCFEKPLVDAGTLGPRCNIQVVYPHVTSSYSDSRDPEEDSIPLCTLKHFPNKIEHCLQWARDTFTFMFQVAVQTLNEAQSNPKQRLSDLLNDNPDEYLEKLFTIMLVLLDVQRSSRNERLQKLVALADFLLQTYFINEIKQLLHNFPADLVCENGSRFWSGPKRPPTPLELQICDAEQFAFIARQPYNHLLAEAN